MSTPLVRGRVRGYDVYEGGETRLGNVTLPGTWRLYSEFRDNLFMYNGAEALAKLLSGDVRYKAAGMYIEFQNVADPGDVVSVPSYDRSGGISYYDNLVSSVDTDYLRVPLTAAVLSSSDESKYPIGNQLNCFATTAGVLGVHGKTFSDSANSKVFGGAVIAIPDDTDATQDLVLARFYFATNKQRVKLANAQLGVEWPLILT